MYRKAWDAIDSVQKAENDPSWRTFYKTYAYAKMQDNTEGPVFKQAFQKEYASAYNKFSFSDKVDAASVDSVYIKELNKGYKDAILDLKKNNSDSSCYNFCTSFANSNFTYGKPIHSRRR